jgi:hypothetical protein
MMGRIGYSIGSFILIITGTVLIANAAAGADSVSAIRESNTVKVDSLHLIPEPVQTDIFPYKVVVKKVDDVDVKLTFVAEYSLTGRVVGIKNYSGTVIDNTVPRDVAMVWGVLTDQIAGAKFIDNKLSVVMEERKASFMIGSWVKDFGGRDIVRASYSNNHLIPCDDNIESLIMAIRKSDYVRIEGYLTNVLFPGGMMNTSVSRTDESTDITGSCEVIYVTDVKWLVSDNYAGVNVKKLLGFLGLLLVGGPILFGIFRSRTRAY